MATEEDNFDIDIYGDGGEDYPQEVPEEATKAEKPPEHVSKIAETTTHPIGSSDIPAYPSSNSQGTHQEQKLENGHPQSSDVAQKIASTDDSTQEPVQLPKHAPQTQGLKRKDGSDDRFVDHGATTALFISELHWWVTDDDVRGWANQSQCEDELEDITFSEHKVNGKSKGQAYVLFKSPQAATAAKQKIESFGEGQQYTKKFTVSYTNPFTNPFRTLPKDGPMRNSNATGNNRSTTGSYGSAGAMNTMPPQPMGYNMSSPVSAGGYRGNRGGGYNNRGAGMNAMQGYNRGGFQQPMAGGFQGAPMSGFQGAPMGGMQSYGGFQNRGGMIGAMRGGPMGMRGGRGSNGMMGMPMGGMGMGGMGNPMGGMGMAMPQMSGGMGMQGMQGFYDYPHANPAGSYPAPAGQYMHHPNPAGQHMPPGFGGQPLAVHRGPPSSTTIRRASNWNNLTQYSPATASITPTSFSSRAAVSTPPLTSNLPEQSGKLKRDASNSGQASFQPNQAHYNPAFFSHQQMTQAGGTGDASWNPHGAKRTRQE